MFTTERSGLIFVDVKGWHIEAARDFRRRADEFFDSRGEPASIFANGLSDCPWVGPLGEMVFKGWLYELGLLRGADYIWESRIENTKGVCDFYFPDGDLFCKGRVGIGIKTVKRKGAPLPHYTAGVTGRQAESGLDDEFFFVSFDTRARRAWLLGGISASTFLKQSEFFPKGARVHANYTARKGGLYNIGIARLHRPLEWLRRFARLGPTIAEPMRRAA